ncbi:MAG: GGDEF domain-containing protein [Polyangiaceae bacterium]|nr:GGDEF domain-containing protein [Polyangiaceae bacterium]
MSDLMDFDDDDEATAVVSLSDLRRKKEVAHKAKHHLLVNIQGTELGRVRELTASELVIGRGTDASIWIPDDGVSRKHARLTRSDESYLCEDLNSANGTFVQGRKVERCQLKDGDQIQLGPKAIFRYSITDDDQKALLEQLYSTSVTDALTGARNREFMDTLLMTEISFAARHRTPLSFLLFDLDHFKSVNDTYGHPAGDHVLQVIAATIRNELRAEDNLCRYGGEEFAIVLRGIEKHGAHASGERLRKRIEELLINYEGTILRVTTSIGIATLDELSETSPQALVSLADQRLYEAKKSGRNRVVSGVSR